ncbi:MAG: hypothetical protein VB997_05680 [Opitutales bacterium]
MRTPSAILLLFAIVSANAHESPIDHVDRRLYFSVKGNDLVLQYSLRQTQRAALLEMRAMDENRDGLISPMERKRYFEARSRRLAGLLHLVESEKTMSFKVAGKVVLRPDFSQEFLFSASLDGAVDLEFTDGFSRQYPGVLVLKKSTPDPKSPLLTIRESPKMLNKRGHVDLTVLEIKIKRNE